MNDDILDSTDALALRALQMLDEIANMDGLRPQLLAAEDELGARLGLVCTGIREPGDVLSYDHGKLPGANRTCPVHEWLTVSDYRVIHEPEREIEARARY